MRSSTLRCTRYPQYLSVLLLLVFLLSRPASADPQKIFICRDGTLASPITDFGKVLSVNPDGSNFTTVRTGQIDYIRGCQYDSAVDKLFIVDLDASDRFFKIYRVTPDNSEQTILQFPLVGENVDSIAGSFVRDQLTSNLFWPDFNNNEIRFASSDNPRKAGPPSENDPQVLFTSPDARVSSPADMEIDPLNRLLYVGNGDGSTAIISLSQPLSRLLSSHGRRINGLAVDPYHKRIFYTLDDNRIISTSLSGQNQIDLTPVVGEPLDFTHRFGDIDYDPDSDKIYWLEYADPNPGFGLSPPPGRLRRANSDGTGAEDVLSDVGYRAILLSLQHGTLKPILDRPFSNETYISTFDLYYVLGEPPAPGTVKINFRQSGSLVASLTMADAERVFTEISPFSDNLNSSGLVTSSTGFPITQGTYTIEITYEDLAGNAASSSTATQVTLALPTPTPTSTPTVTATSTATSTPTQTATPTHTSTPTQTPTVTSTPTPTPTVTATPSATPTATVTPINTATETPTPQITATPSETITPVVTATVGVTTTLLPTPSATPTIDPDTECVSSASLPTVKVTRKGTSLTISGKKGALYIFRATPVGLPKRRPIRKAVRAVKKGKLTTSLGILKAGVWEFSYSVKIKKTSTQSCPVIRKTS